MLPPGFYLFLSTYIKLSLSINLLKTILFPSGHVLSLVLFVCIFQCQLLFSSVFYYLSSIFSSYYPGQLSTVQVLDFTIKLNALPCHFDFMPILHASFMMHLTLTLLSTMLKNLDASCLQCHFALLHALNCLL